MSYKYAFFFPDCQILMLDLQKIDYSHIFRFPEYCLIRKKNIPLLRLFPTRTVCGKRNTETVAIGIKSAHINNLTNSRHIILSN